jgi:hypothetical protein
MRLRARSAATSLAAVVGVIALAVASGPADAAPGTTDGVIEVTPTFTG